MIILIKATRRSLNDTRKTNSYGIYESWKYGIESCEVLIFDKEIGNVGHYDKT